ncbi:AzlD domain-containing protein [Catelliglobosispora koreensis]|uniref:AzlD domain-containing protein n=1 Tax=Catelliglobosispora koreensis TaxID=129052 RepID=UPI000374B86E|nr:AzlD domain-containing protein [Catelliglobosispora koreensis]
MKLANSTVALVIAALAVGTYAIRVSGVMLRDKLKLPEGVLRLLPVAATTMLLALIATAVLTNGDKWELGIARPAGVLAGALLAWRKAPFIVVVLVAAVTAAGLRAIGVE